MSSQHEVEYGMFETPFVGWVGWLVGYAPSISSVFELSNVEKKTRLSLF